MAAIQEICARIGRCRTCRQSSEKLPATSALLCACRNVGGEHLYPRADIGVIGASLALVIPMNVMVLTVTLGIVSLIAVLFIPYSTYAKYLKNWLTLSLSLHRRRLLCACSVVRRASRDLDSTCCTDQGISDGLDCCTGHHHQPHLFFWPASQEVEEVRTNRRKGPETRAGPGCRAIGPNPYAHYVMAFSRLSLL